MKRKHFVSIYTMGLLLGAMFLVSSCGSDDEEGGDSGKKNNSTESDTADSDTLDMDTLDIDSADIVNVDTIDIDVKRHESAVELAEKGQEGKAEAANAVFVNYDLSDPKYNLPLPFNITISLPAGTVVEANDLEEAVLTFGGDFVLEVGENYDGTIAECKSRFKGNLHNQMMGYVVDEPNGFIRKIKSNGVISHNLFYNINDGTTDIMIKSSMSRSYSQAEILEMWKACQTIKVK